MAHIHHVAAVIVCLVAGTTTAATNIDPPLLRYTDEIANTAEIGLLRNSEFPNNRTEIRVWIGFGVITPDEMLRLQLQANGELSGEVLVYFPSDLTYMNKRSAKRFRDGIMRSCTRLRKGTKVDVCTATFKKTPNWNALYEQLNRLGITTLPDESELPRPDVVVFDGISMVVEVREGSSYRAYQYSNPHFRREPESNAAQQIIRAIADAIRQ